MLQNNSVLSLLEKFDNLEINSTDRISKDDKNFCENIQKEYDLLNQQLNKYIEIFKKLDDEETNNPYSLQESEWRGERIELKDNPKWYERFIFSPLYPLTACKKFSSKGRKRFIQEIGNYFEGKYNLSLKLDKLIESEKPVSYHEVVEEIIEQAGGGSLKERGVRNLVDDFKNCVRYNNRITVKSNKISISNYIYYSYYSLPVLKIDRTDRQIHALILAMSHFENEGTHPLKSITDYMPGRSYSDEVNPLVEYGFPDAEKLQSIKFFKNRRIDIKFKTEYYARKFYTYFELGSLEEK